MAYRKFYVIRSLAKQILAMNRQILYVSAVLLLLIGCRSSNFAAYEFDKGCPCTQNQPNYNAQECERFRLQEPERYWRYIGSVAKNPGYFEVTKCSDDEWIVRRK
jgi:hypothetical protein